MFILAKKKQKSRYFLFPFETNIHRKILIEVFYGNPANIETIVLKFCNYIFM